MYAVVVKLVPNLITDRTISGYKSELMYAHLPLAEMAPGRRGEIQKRTTNFCSMRVQNIVVVTNNANSIAVEIMYKIHSQTALRWIFPNRIKCQKNSRWRKRLKHLLVLFPIGKQIYQILSCGKTSQNILTCIKQVDWKLWQSNFHPLVFFKKKTFILRAWEHSVGN